MHYISTRDGLAACSFAEAALCAPDGGGLYVPEKLPEISCKDLSELDFAERCEKVVCAFLGDIAVGTAEAVRHDFGEEGLPVVKIDDNFFAVELWHGKTYTARDLALSVLATIYENVERAGIKFARKVNNVNSSIAYVAAQVACMFSLYCDLADSGEIALGDKIELATPITGSGNILAAWYAREMGLPICKIICADADSRAMYDFVGHGTFEPRESDMRFIDELERMMYLLSGNDAPLTAKRMTELEKDGKFSLTSLEAVKLRFVVACENVTREGVYDGIADAFDEYGYLFDPVSAAAVVAAERYARRVPIVVTAMAHPYTAAKEVLTALGEETDGSMKDMLGLLEDITAMEIPEALENGKR